MKNLLLTTAAATLLIASTIAQADDSSIAGASTDTLGIPSSALILTDDVAADTRGQSWIDYREAYDYWTDQKCALKLEKGTNQNDGCTDLAGSDKNSLEGLKEQWLDAKELHMGVLAGTETNDEAETKAHRLSSY